MENKMFIKKTYWIEYGHSLKDHPGLCQNLHGHSGKIEVTFEGNVKDETGMVYDFGEFEWLKRIIDEFDHSTIFQRGDSLFDWILEGIDKRVVRPLRLVVMKDPPTAENISLYLKNKIEEYIAQNKGNPGVSYSEKMFDPWFYLYSVSFEETRKNETTWRAG